MSPEELEKFKKEFEEAQAAVKESYKKFNKEHYTETVYTLLMKRPYYGTLLQLLDVKITNAIPTAGIAYNKDRRSFELYMSPLYMSEKTVNERVAILIHELHHIVYGHVYYDVKKEDMKRWNIAMDISINQKITDLPDEAMFVERFKDKQGNPFPLNKTTEIYYDLLDGAEYEDKNGKGHSLDELGEFDKHEWSDADKDDMKQAAMDLMKRAVEKASTNFGKDSESIKDDIASIEKELTKIKGDLDQLNYLKLLNHAIKKSLPSRDRKNTWTKPSKRWGYQAPGRIYDYNPKIDFYYDTSGSISINEMKEFNNHTHGFLKHIKSKCSILFFHTSVYDEQDFKLGKDMDTSRIESGGTDLDDVIETINKRGADLSIILTDGYYSNVETKTNKKIIFVISKQGSKEHPLNYMGITVKVE